MLLPAEGLADEASVEKLVTFLRRIEEFGTLAFAARRLHLSQDAVLARLSTYESALGTELVRSGDALYLTEAARRLLGGGGVEGHSPCGKASPPIA